MKKCIVIAVLSLFLYSCGPKRMSCYGKRCVENSVQKDVQKVVKVNS